MSNKLYDSLNVLLCEDEIDLEYISDAQSTAAQLEDLKHQTDLLSRKITAYHHRMCADLSLALRRTIPNLNISLRRGCCIVGFNKNSLTLSPDTRMGVWSVKSDANGNKFAKRFLQRHASKTVVTGDLNPLVQAIVAFFTNHYKSLGESMEGTGLIFIEGKKSSVFDLVEMCDPRKYN